MDHNGLNNYAHYDLNLHKIVLSLDTWNFIQITLKDKFMIFLQYFVMVIYFIIRLARLEYKYNLEIRKH